MIIFAGFSPGNERRYNYIKSFRHLNIDKLYLLDTWGYKGCYYLFENGSNLPMNSIDNILRYYMGKKKYNKIFTAGSSKGGSSALFFGLRHNVSAIFSGACQYNLGTYLYCEKHNLIFFGMMGKSAGFNERDFFHITNSQPPDKQGYGNLLFSPRFCSNMARILCLDKLMPQLLSKNCNSNTIIHLLYSKMESTYIEEIVDLIND